MVNSVNELKELIVWLKTQRVKSLSIGEISIEISDYAHLEGVADESMATKPSKVTDAPSAENNGLDELISSTDKVDDDDLYFSAR